RSPPPSASARVPSSTPPTPPGSRPFRRAAAGVDRRLALGRDLLQGAGHVQREARDGGAEDAPVTLVHLVRALHRTDRRRQYAAARIAVHVAAVEDRLLADHARAFDFLHLPVAVRDDPVPAPELRPDVVLVRNGDEICEGESALLGARMLLEV